jgi:hypothetical protein
MTDVTFLENFYEEEESDEENFERPPRKKRRINRIWSEHEVFDSAKEAEDVVTSRGIWKKHTSSTNSTGKRVEYRCTAGMYRKNECPAGLYLLYDACSEKVSLYETECGHDNHVTDPTRGLSTDLKEYIRKKFSEGVTKPNSLLNSIRQAGLKEPDKSKLVAFLKTVREAKYGSPTISAAELYTWCEEKKKTPRDEDEPFVLDYLVEAKSRNVDDRDLKIVISTRRLLSLCRRSPLVQIDATYKLIWQGYPVIIAGTTDKNKVFHPFLLAVTTCERADDFEFVFHALHQMQLEWFPSLLLADASDAITAGFVAVFGPPTVRIQCFFHVLKNIETYLKPLPAAVRVSFKHDLHTLQSSQDANTFQKASRLFVKKWKKSENQRTLDLIQYVETQWLEKNACWYEGAAVGYPSTNNGLESTNAVIKREHSLRERLPVGQFVNKVVHLVTQWSERRNPNSVNCIEFAEIPRISLQLWTVAYQWAAADKAILQRPHEKDGCTQYFVASSAANKSITEKLLSKFLKGDGKWRTFEEFKVQKFEIWVIVINSSSLHESTCTCPTFLKSLQCKHTVGMCIRLKLLTVPPEAKTIPLGLKRKRGRPSKAKRALLVQWRIFFRSLLIFSCFINFFVIF